MSNTLVKIINLGAPNLLNVTFLIFFPFLNHSVYLFGFKKNEKRFFSFEFTTTAKLKSNRRFMNTL